MVGVCTGWNDRIVALEKTIWFHFRLMKTGFLFFVADHLLVGHSDRSLLSCLKVTQCSTSEIEMRRCTTMLSTDPCYDNRTIASTLKVQIRTVQRLREQLDVSDKPDLDWEDKEPQANQVRQAPLLPQPEPAGLLRLVIRREHHQHDLPQHQSQPDRRHPPSIHRAFAGACGKGMLTVPDPYRSGDQGWRWLHWIDVSSTT